MCKEVRELQFNRACREDENSEKGAFLFAAVNVTCRFTWRLEVNKHLLT